ncbi:MAG: efflux RND transporter permease subunit, partial [Lachnospiraceae bacterium]|nr:efflux RND transporter permease subunit [Lachnospiraceae bacterium]
MIKYSVKKPFTVLVVVIGILMLAAVSLTQMTTNLLPEISTPYLMVVTTYPGASPEKVELEVTTPLEDVLSTVNDVKTVTSTSAENYSLITMEFLEDTDMDSALVKVNTQIDTVEPYLPDRVGTPTIMEISLDMLATMYVAVERDGMDIYELTDYVNDEVLPYFQRQEGVASVSAIGLVEKTVELRLDKKKIDSLNDKLATYASDELAKVQGDLDDAQAEIDKGKRDLDQGDADLNREQEERSNELASYTKQMNEAVATQSAYNATLTSLKANQTALNVEKKAYEDAGVKTAHSQVETLLQSIPSIITPMAEGKTQAADGAVQAQAGIAQLSQTLLTLNTQKQAVNGAIEAAKAAALAGGADETTAAAAAEAAGESYAAGLVNPVAGITYGNARDASNAANAAAIAAGEATAVTAVNILDQTISSVQSQIDQAESGLSTAQNTQKTLSTVSTNINDYALTIADAVNYPDKLANDVALFNYLKSSGQGNIPDEALAALNTDTLTQLYNAVDVRLPQIETELKNLETEITANQMAMDQVNSAVNEAMSKYEELEAGKITAAAAFGSGAAAIASGRTALEDAQTKLDEAVENYKKSRDEALKAANLDELLTLDTLSQVITAQNFSMPAGYIDDKNDAKWLVKVGTEIESTDELKDMILADVEGVGQVRLEDVADLVITDNAADSYAKMNGEPAVLLSIYKSSTAGTSTVSNTCNEAMDQIMAEVEGLHITPLMDQGEYIAFFINSVVTNMLQGAVFAILVLIVFFRSAKPTLVVAFSIPFSVLLAILIMYFTDISINIMSLSGLSLGIGMLVDNSIVVIENIYRLRSKGLEAPRAAVQGTKQVAGAITSSTLTTI